MWCFTLLHSFTIDIADENSEPHAVSMLKPTCNVLQAILMLGGHDGQQWTTLMHLFHPTLGQVQEYDQVPFTQGYGGSVLLGRSVYVMGGGDGVHWNKSAYSYALDSRDWFQVSGSLGAVLCPLAQTVRLLVC